MKNITLGQLIDNGLLNGVGQIVVDDMVYCHSWNIENDIVLKDAADDEGTEIQFLVFFFDDDNTTRFRLDSEVEFDGLDLIIVEDRSQTEQVLAFQKIIDIDPKQFANKN